MSDTTLPAPPEAATAPDAAPPSSPSPASAALAAPADSGAPASNSGNHSGNHSNSGDGDELSLLDLAIALGEEKKTVFGCALAAAVLVAGFSLSLPNLYAARTVLLPPQQPQSGAASALASLGALAGLAGSAGLKTQDEMYVAFLNSESLQNQLIQDLKLKARYDITSLADTRLKLKSLVRVTSDKKTGLITLEAEDTDPEFAAQLANAHVNALRAMLTRLAVTEAQQRRVFFEQHIRKVQDALAKAELGFRAAKEKSGLQVTAVLAETGVRASAELRGQIAAREVQLQAMSRFATAQNPEVQRVSSELHALRSQLARIEQGSGAEAGAAAGLHQEAVNAYREVKVQEAMLEALIKQYELARVDEAKEGPLLQQVDVANPPEKKARPARALMSLTGALAGLFLGLLLAFVRRALRSTDPDAAQRLQALRRAWRLKKA